MSSSGSTARNLLLATGWILVAVAITVAKLAELIGRIVTFGRWKGYGSRARLTPDPR